jgi:glycosyltransferase involved in cell wall biosynthesis
MNKLQIIVIAYHRATALRLLIDSFLLQTNSDWYMTIIHDGPAPDDVLSVIRSYNDSRINFTATEDITSNHGYYIRKGVLPILNEQNGNYLLNTNDDNYYVPRFIELMFREIRDDSAIVFCDTVHSHQEYDTQESDLKVSHIDMGAFIVRLDVAKQAGFNHDTYAYDGYFAEDCKRVSISKGLGIHHVRKPLFIHN